MSALAEQQSRYAEARTRLGMPVTPVRRISCELIGRVPVVVEPVAPPEEPKPNKARRQMHWSRIIREVSEKHGIDEETILGPSRRPSVVMARNEAMWRMRHEITVAGKPMSFPQIGRRFGRDHTTVLHSLKCHRKVMEKSPENLGGPYAAEPTFASGPPN